RGVVIVIPLLNRPGFYERSIYVNPEDNDNINRVFPGRPDGTWSERFAHRLRDRPARRGHDRGSGAVRDLARERQRRGGPQGEADDRRLRGGMGGEERPEWRAAGDAVRHRGAARGPGDDRRVGALRAARGGRRPAPRAGG